MKYTAEIADRLKEDRIKHALFKKLREEDKESSVILEWKGRKERRLLQHKVHNSRFLAEFDLAVFKRVNDKRISPVLIAYEVKGLKNRGKNYYAPPIHIPVGQSITHFQEDANQSYIVTIPREIKAENEALINIVKEHKYMGLIFVTVRNKKLFFKPVVKPTKFRRSKNQDRKKCNLHLVSVWERYWAKHIQRQEWARSAEFYV